MSKTALTDAQMEQLMNGVTERIEKLTDEERYVISTCFESILNGSSWGFVKKSVAQAFGDASQYNNDYTQVYELDRATLVEANPQKVVEVLNKVTPTSFAKSVVEDFLEGRKRAYRELQKFLENKAKGGKAYKGYIGIYSVNKTQTMTYNKERYSAFQLTLPELVRFAYEHPQYELVVSIKKWYGSLQELSTMGSSPRAALNNLQPSEGTTSLVLPIAIRKVQ